MSRTPARSMVVVSMFAAALGLPAAAAAQMSTSATASAPFAAVVVDPCTNQSVSISGTATFSLMAAVNGNGQQTFRVATLTRATGTTSGTAPVKYGFSDSDFVSIFAPAPQPLDLAFLSKINAKGTTAGDQWRLRVVVRISATETGQITATSASASAGACIG